MAKKCSDKCLKSTRASEDFKTIANLLILDYIYTKVNEKYSGELQEEDHGRSDPFLEVTVRSIKYEIQRSL